MKKNKIPTKNYIILFVISMIVVLLTFYISAWFKTYKIKKLETSPMEGIIEKLDIKEMKMSISEMNEVVLYFGYLNDEKIHEMEKRIISFAKREDIISKMIYIDITNYKAEDKYKEIIKETFTDLESIPSAPMILYIKNGEVKDMIEPENGLIQTYQIKNLIDKYDLAN